MLITNAIRVLYLFNLSTWPKLSSKDFSDYKLARVVGTGQWLRGWVCRSKGGGEMEVVHN